MSQFAVQHVRFFRPSTQAIHCMAYDAYNNYLALSRSDGSIEVYRHYPDGVRFVYDFDLPSHIATSENPASIEALTWYNGRLFSAGINGSIVEYDLERLAIARSLSLDSTAVWAINAVTSSGTGGGLLACGCDSGSIYLVNLLTADCSITPENTLELTGPPLRSNSGRVLSLAWVSGDQYLVAGGIGGIHVWKTSSSRPKIAWHMALPDKVVVWSVVAYPSEEPIFASSDSRGMVSIWNAKHGTMISELLTHSLDVLTLSVGTLTDECPMIFATGADPAVVAVSPFSLNNLNNVDSWTNWEVHRFNAHDVRASCFVAPNLLLTAGVDRHITVAQMNTTPKSRKVDRAFLFQRIPPVHNWADRISVERITSSQSVLAIVQPCAEPGDYSVEIWQLLATPQDYESADDANKEEKLEPNRQLVITMPVNLAPQLVKLSPLANFLAFATGPQLRVFKLDIRVPSASKHFTMSFESNSRKHPAPTVTDISFANETSKSPVFVLTADAQLCIRSVWHPNLMKTFSLADDFSSENAGTGNSALPTLFLKTCVEESNGSFDSIIVAIGSRTVVRLYKCQYNEDNEAEPFTLESICRLPTYTDGAVTAIALYPSLFLLVAFSNRRVAEFNGNTQHYTKWTRRSLVGYKPSKSKAKKQRLSKSNENGENKELDDVERAYPRPWLELQETIDWIGYSSSTHAKILTAGSKVVATIDTTAPLPLQLDGPLFKPSKFSQKYSHTLPAVEEPQSNSKTGSIHPVSRFRYVLAFDCLKPFEEEEASTKTNDEEADVAPGELFVAEFPPGELASQLPPMVVTKKQFSS